MIQLVGVSLAALVVLMLGELVPDPGAAPDVPPAAAVAPPAEAGTPLPNPLPAARGEGIGSVDTGAETVVTATTPLHGSRLPRERVPANVQTATADAIAQCTHWKRGDRLPTVADRVQDWSGHDRELAAMVRFEQKD